MKLLPKEILHFSQLFGGFPMKFALSSIDKSAEPKFSAPLFLWNLVLITLQVMVTALGLYTDYVEKLAGYPIRLVSDYAYLVILLEIISLNLVLPAVIFSCSRKYQLFVNIFGILEKAERNLKQDLQELKTKMKMFATCSVIIALIVSTGVLDYTKSLSSGREDHIKSLCYIPTKFMYFAQAAMFLHFTQITKSVALKFRTINAMIKEELIRIRREQILIRGSHQRISILGNAGDRSPSCRIKRLIDTYWLLCDAVQQANTFYGDQLMVTFFSSFAHITTTLYHFFFLIVHGVSMTAIVDGAWILAHVAHLVLMTRPCTLVSELADNMAPTICKFINMDLDPTLAELLEGMLLQLREHNASISAFGFFPINNSTLTGMAGAVTTYVVILIQFQS